MHKITHYIHYLHLPFFTHDYLWIFSDKGVLIPPAMNSPDAPGEMYVLLCVFLFCYNFISRRITEGLMKSSFLVFFIEN